MDKMIVKRVRKSSTDGNGRGTPFATLIATKGDNDVVTISWSKCHKTDHFDGKVGIDVAKMRMKHRSLRRPVPFKIRKDIEAFKQRSSKYFRVKVEDIVTL